MIRTHALLPRLALLPRWQVTCFGLTPGSRAAGYWWGHDTIEDQAKRKAETRKKDLMAWTDPNQMLEEKKEMQWSPNRIIEEAEMGVAMSERGIHRGAMTNHADMQNWVHKRLFRPYALSFLLDPIQFREQTIDKYHAKLIKAQIFVPSRLTALGPDLAAAHFLCHRNCKVRFKGHKHWTELADDGTLDIPATYVPGWYVEAIEASDSLLLYEGLQNLKNLHHLKELDLSYCRYIDEWCMDRITGEYHATLETLNISGCREVNWNGLEVVWRLGKLKTLIIKDMDHIQDLTLICLMLLDVLPNLKIVGAEYLDMSLLKGTEWEHLLLDDGSFPRLEPGEVQEVDGEARSSQRESNEDIKNIALSS
jgi:hypothetical protein